MMIRLALLSLVAAQPALALSCLAPSVARSTVEAVSAEETFRIAVGSFFYDEVELPADGTSIEPTETSIPAVFDGHALTREGFTTEVSSEVVLQVECIGPSCGSVPADTEALAFFREVGGELVLDVNACPGWVFPEPTEAQLETVRNCVVDQDCPEG
ncbi:hypothetical protein [Palleronia sp.]|uniref:hypothetical protein n=1 Tax=Palleronia sp. TaxID=1940284 RepID=UPI0035C7DB8D